MQTAIRCEGAGKKFCKSLTRSMVYGGMDILMSAFGGLPRSGVLRADEFWALKGADLQLEPGESFGIIGPNGSGKTTLLKLLNGIFMPDEGRITVCGRVGALIQVGAGFHPLLSGRENIFINGSILGMSQKEIQRNFDSIVDFADIGDFLDSPVKFYSSGMYVRLGFAIAIHCRPDILLIDEILAVGDIKFQSKCLKFITNNVLKSGCTVVFVSHNRYAVEDVCQRALYLKKGVPVKIGQTSEVIGAYLKDIKNEEEGFGPNGVFGQEGITKVLFFDEQNQLKDKFASGDKLKIRFYYSFQEAVVSPSFAITFIHHDPRFMVASSTDYMFNLHSGYDGFELGKLQGQGYVEVVVDQLYIPVGTYRCFVYLYNDNHMNLVNKYENAASLEVVWTKDAPQRSLIELPHRWALGGKASR